MFPAGRSARDDRYHPPAPHAFRYTAPRPARCASAEAPLRGARMLPRNDLRIDAVGHAARRRYYSASLRCRQERVCRLAGEEMTAIETLDDVYATLVEKADATDVTQQERTMLFHAAEDVRFRIKALELLAEA